MLSYTLSVACEAPAVIRATRSRSGELEGQPKVTDAKTLAGGGPQWIQARDLV
jgi:hypothetical protein